MTAAPWLFSLVSMGWRDLEGTRLPLVNGNSPDCARHPHKEQSYLHMARCAIHIGTSGWHYKHWVGTFYPEKMPTSKMFEYYAERFDTVELNNSFYRLPTEEAFRAWRDAAPKKFTFAVK